MTWLSLYSVAVLATVILCWGRGYGFRRASLILAANLLVQVGCQKIMGESYAPSFRWMWLDLVTAIAVVRCPWAGRTHSFVAATLGLQVLIHLAYWARGNPMAEERLYLDVIGALGWAQLAMLVGGAHAPLRRIGMAWLVGRRPVGAVQRHQNRMEAGQ